MHDDLTRLAIIHGADKFGYHDYTPNYFEVLSSRRNDPLRLLEIGVGGYGDGDRGGYSLRMWRDFFPNAQIVGVDIHAKTLDVGDRVTICQGSQVDAEFLRQLVEEHGPFDVIVDDGSHFNEHVVETYNLLFPTLAPGGVYLAEDLQTAFRANRGGSLTLDAPNSLRHFMDIQFGILSGKAINGAIAVERFHNMVGVHKATLSQGESSVLLSGRLDRLSGPIGGPVRVLFIGETDGESPSDWTRAWSERLRTSLEASFDPRASAVDEAFDEFDKFDLIVCRLTTAGAWKNCGLAEMIGLLDTDGVLVYLTDAVERQHLAEGSLAMADVRRAFVEIDHLELLASFPEAQVSALAPQVRSMQAHADGLLLHKADNTYPSNFTFNFAHRRVKDVTARIEAVLAEASTEDGLLQGAEIMRRAGRPDLAKAYIDRIFTGVATRRMSYFTATDLARETGDSERYAWLCEAGFAAFPAEFRFALKLVDVKRRLGDLAGAEAVLFSALETSPRQRQLYAALTDLLRHQQKWAEAIEANSLSIKFHPRAERPGLSVKQAEMHLLLDQPDAAMRALHRTIADVEAYAPSHRLLSELEWRKGDADAARASIARAIEIDPGNATYQSFQKKIADGQKEM